MEFEPKVKMIFLEVPSHSVAHAAGIINRLASLVRRGAQCLFSHTDDEFHQCKTLQNEGSLTTPCLLASHVH